MSREENLRRIKEVYNRMIGKDSLKEETEPSASPIEEKLGVYDSVTLRRLDAERTYRDLFRRGASAEMGPPFFVTEDPRYVLKSLGLIKWH